ncbi:MAG: sigma 54-interacting transcriptional regulator [Acidobacteriaceae bacterium]|nr:sigma 54-interacting transcriptional regulator [Acidobacteriaceae bacterium]
MPSRRKGQCERIRHGLRVRTAVAHRRGKVESADSGTLFLDEIGEMPLELQVKLLRLIQQGEIERVGAPSATTVNIRIIAATHRNLEAMIEDGTFREDLYYRLSVIPLELPPLRERSAAAPRRYPVTRTSSIQITANKRQQYPAALRS